MATYYITTTQAKAMCDLYIKLGGGLLSKTGTDSAGNASNEFAGTDLAKALSVFTVTPLSTGSAVPVSLRQLANGDIVHLELDFCKECDQQLIRCIGILNAIFENEFIVPNKADASNTNGAQFCVVIGKPASKCLC